MPVGWRGLAGGDFNQPLVKTEAAAGCVTALTGVSGGPSVNVTEGRQARRDVRRLQTVEVTGAASGGSRWREPACQDSRRDRRQVKRIRGGLEAVRNRWEVIGAACDPACDRCVFFFEFQLLWDAAQRYLMESHRKYNLCRRKEILKAKTFTSASFFHLKTIKSIKCW